MSCPVCFHPENTLVQSRNCGHVISCDNCFSRTLIATNNRCPEVGCNTNVTHCVLIAIEPMECENED
jgi:hypothetical protein